MGDSYRDAADGGGLDDIGSNPAAIVDRFFEADDSLPAGSGSRTSSRRVKGFVAPSNVSEEDLAVGSGGGRSRRRNNRFVYLILGASLIVFAALGTAIGIVFALRSGADNQQRQQQQQQQEEANGNGNKNGDNTGNGMPVTLLPTASPSMKPVAQTEAPMMPMAAMTTPPSAQPTIGMTTMVPTMEQTNSTSNTPSTLQPSIYPSAIPTVKDFLDVSQIPSNGPTPTASTIPSAVPTAIPTPKPSMSQYPTEMGATNNPTNFPSYHPSTTTPSQKPSILLSVSPSKLPSLLPSAQPSLLPSEKPTVSPSKFPSSKPTEFPTLLPSHSPSRGPMSSPTLLPSYLPSSNPTESQSNEPSRVPTNPPTLTPSFRPSKAPTLPPSTANPTNLPTPAPVPLEVLSILTTAYNNLSPSVGDDIFDDQSLPRYQAYLWSLGDTMANNQLTEIDIVQRFTMATVYFAFNGDNWRNNALWLSSSHNVCEWSQVECDDGLIVGLDLDNNSLLGDIPFFDLALISSTLLQIDLWTSDLAFENLLVGGISRNIGLLTNLRYLRLGGDPSIDFFGQLVTSLPPEIGNLQQLTTLSIVGYAYLSGAIPSELGLLTMLTSLDLRNNFLSGTVPTDLSALADTLRLIGLDGGNELTGDLGIVFCRDLDQQYDVFRANCAPGRGLTCSCCSQCF